MQSLAQKQSPTRQQSSPAFAKPDASAAGNDLHAIQNLQSFAGNQAMLHLVRSQAADSSDHPNSPGTGTPLPRPASPIATPPFRPTPRLTLQTKLTVNTPGDAYEQEADRVAEQVMRGSTAESHVSCACGGTCDSCRKESTQAPGQHLQRREDAPSISPHPGRAGSQSGIEAPASVHQVLQSPGEPLDGATRDLMESRFGQDFGHVRVHSDRTAAASADAVGALAYTSGSSIVFKEGQYAPQKEEGQRLLAHELTHVAQQQSAVHGESTTVQLDPDKGKPDAQKLREFKKSKEWRNYVKTTRDLEAVNKKIEAFKKTKEYAALQRYEQAQANLDQLRGQYAAKQVELTTARVDLAVKTKQAEDATEKYRIAKIKAEEAAREAHFWGRILGGVEAVCHTIEAAVTCPLAETGIGAVGCIHATTSLYNDLETVSSGDPKPNLFQQAGASTAKMLGAGDETANVVGAIVDALGGAASIKAAISRPMAVGKTPSVASKPLTSEDIDAVQAQGRRIRRDDISQAAREIKQNAIKEEVHSGIRSPETEMLEQDIGRDQLVDVADDEKSLGEAGGQTHHKTQVSEAPELGKNEENLEALEKKAHRQGAHGNRFREQRAGGVADPKFDENPGTQMDKRRVVDSGNKRRVPSVGQPADKNLTVEQEAEITARPKDLTLEDIMNEQAVREFRDVMERLFDFDPEE